VAGSAFLGCVVKGTDTGLQCYIIGASFYVVPAKAGEHNKI